MNVYSIIIFKQPSIVLSSAFFLDKCMFWEKSSIQEILRFVSKEVVSRTKNGEQNSILHKEYMCHCFIHENGLACAVITNEEYPSRIVFNLIHHVLEEFTTWKNAEFDFPLIQELIVKY